MYQFLDLEQVICQGIKVKFLRVRLAYASNIDGNVNSMLYEEYV